MRGGVASDGTGVAFQDAGSAHNCSWSFSSAVSGSDRLFGTNCWLALQTVIVGG
jgi:hypothetical protein